jgi:glycerate 2-kinase
LLLGIGNLDMMSTGIPVHQDALDIINAGIDSVRPSKLFSALSKNPNDPNLVRWLNSEHRWLLCLGKAGLASAESILQVSPCTDYFVVSPHDKIPSTLDPNKIHFGSHPLPDRNSFSAAAKLLDWLKKIPEGSNLLVILSGGTSSLVASPAEGISEKSKTTLNDLLIKSGAKIEEINTVRKHCSRVKGGQLGLAVHNLQTMVLVISDVASNDLSAIGSGPFYVDNTTFVAAKDILKRFNIWNKAPEDIRLHLAAGIEGEIQETPKSGSLNIPHLIVASNGTARDAAKSKAEQLGYTAAAIGDSLVGPIENAAEQILEHINSMPDRSAIVLGGEVTIRVTGNGIGGRNQHLALLLTEALASRRIVFASAGTDGIDGNSTAAGAWTDGNTFEKAKSINLSIREYLANNNSFHFFEKLNQSIVTGPTGTNVMDLYLVLSS